MFLPPYPSSTLVHPVVCNCLENFRGIPNWLQMCKDAHHRPLHQEDDITLHASFKSSSFNTELGDTIVPDSQCACGEWWDYNSSWQCSVPRNLTALFSLEFPLPLWSHLILNLFYGFLTLLMYYSSRQSFTDTSLDQNKGEDYQMSNCDILLFWTLFISTCQPWICMKNCLACILWN